jgi:hypothetical protein
MVNTTRVPTTQSNLGYHVDQKEIATENYFGTNTSTTDTHSCKSSSNSASSSSTIKRKLNQHLRIDKQHQAPLSAISNNNTKAEKVHRPVGLR